MSSCLASDTLPQAPGMRFDLEVTAVVAAVRSPEPDEPCGPGPHGVYRVGLVDLGPDVMIDLELPDGSTLTLGAAIPGLTQDSVAPGETLAVHHHVAILDAPDANDMARSASLEITRDGALVAAIGENVPAGPVAPSQGADECWNDPDSPCVRIYTAMQVTTPDGATVSIGTGQTEQAGGLLVTNDHIYDNHSVGDCSFALAMEYVVGAVAQ